MQLARLAVETHPAIVPDAVSHIGSLLDFGQIATCANGVDAAGRKEEHISGSHIIAAEHGADFVFRHQFLKLLWSDAAIETAVEIGSLARTDDVPHLGLSLGVVTHAGQLVIGMDLDGEIVVGIDELDQQRELTRENIRDLLPLGRTLGHYRFIAGNSGEHPALRAPDKSLEYGCKLVHTI